MLVLMESNNIVLERKIRKLEDTEKDLSKIKISISQKLSYRNKIVKNLKSRYNELLMRNLKIANKSVQTDNEVNYKGIQCNLFN